MLAVLPVGLLPVLLLALLAAVVEDLAAAASQSDLALFLLPVVHGTVCAGVFKITSQENSNVFVGHPHKGQPWDAKYFQ